VGIPEDLLEEILDVEHLVRHEAKHLPEPAVLFARACPEQDVVEKQVLHHRRHHAVDLATGLVDENRPQAADLGVDGESHGGPRRGGTGRLQDANLNPHGTAR